MTINCSIFLMPKRSNIIVAPSTQVGYLCTDDGKPYHQKGVKWLAPKKELTTDTSYLQMRDATQYRKLGIKTKEETAMFYGLLNQMGLESGKLYIKSFPIKGESFPYLLKEAEDNSLGIVEGEYRTSPNGEIRALCSGLPFDPFGDEEEEGVIMISHIREI